MPKRLESAVFVSPVSSATDTIIENATLVRIAHLDDFLSFPLILKYDELHIDTSLSW